MPLSLCMLILLLLLSSKSYITGGRGVERPSSELYQPDYRLYHNLEQTERTIQALLSEYPVHLRSFHNFKTQSQRNIPVLVLKNYTDTMEADSMKRRVLLVFGSHARELLPVECAIHFLKSVLEPLSLVKHTGNKAAVQSSSLDFTRFLLRHFVVYLVPLLNPDGRAQLESERNLCWRGNARGVDPERNFPWEWGGTGSSGQPSDEEFRGERPFSDPESALIRDLTNSVDQFHCAISFHSGIQQIYLPFSVVTLTIDLPYRNPLFPLQTDSRSAQLGRKPANLPAMTQLANHLASALPPPHPAFQVGQMPQLGGYSVGGTLIDYLVGERRVPLALSLELWGRGDTGQSGCFDTFNPESGHLEHTLVELYPIFSALFRFLGDSSRLPNLSLKQLLPVSQSNSRHHSKSQSVTAVSSWWASRSVIGYLVLGLLLLMCALCKRRVVPQLKEVFCAGKRIVSLRNFGSSLDSLKKV